MMIIIIRRGTRNNISGAVLHRAHYGPLYSFAMCLCLCVCVCVCVCVLN